MSLIVKIQASKSGCENKKLAWIKNRGVIFGGALFITDRDRDKDKDKTLFLQDW